MVLELEKSCWWRSALRRAGQLSGLLLAAALGGCGGGGGSGPDAGVATAADAAEEAADDTGKIVIALTDAEGDFLAYSLKLSAIRLEHANGDVVETLPLSTSVDFTELTEVTEFLTIATVPVGVYESVSLDLDFTDAEIVVQDEAGDGVRVTAVDESGMPLRATSVRLQLTGGDVVRIAPGIPAAFSLDFDLDASNEIDLAATPPAVTVLPVLFATAEFEADRVHRLRGALTGVDEGANTVTLAVRPFRHRSGGFGEFEFLVDAVTVYEIDGEPFTGSDGLATMALLADTTPVVAAGMVVEGALLAQTVLAGSSVPWTAHDVVKGVVSARSGDVLTVRGASIEYRDGVHVFRGEVAVTLGPDTWVTALGIDTGNLDSASISVGQRILAFGELRTDADDVALDVTGGRVRMLMNQLTARVVTPTPLVVDLAYLNGRRPRVFDFSGTGPDPVEDADPMAYRVEVGALDLSPILAGDLVRVRGLVSEHGLAPPDFLARTVIDVQSESRSATLLALWPEASGTPFSAVEPARIEVDLELARSLLKARGVPVGVTNPLQSLALLATADNRGVFAVRVRGAGEIHLYRQFDELVAQLLAQLDAGNTLRRITAHGSYNGNLELTTRRASFDFQASTDTAQ